MELIVRTAHGAADVAVDMLDHAVALRDLIAAVTGQASPGTAQVDGRLVNTNQLIEACGLVTGSVIDTMLDPPPDRSNPPAAILRQLTGPGAGRALPLPVGRYRVGPGRRQQSSELALDATDVAAFELDIKQGGKIAQTRATVSGPPKSPMGPVSIGHAVVQRPTSWSQGPLVSGGRLFRLEPIAAPRSPTVINEWSPNAAGFVIHNRPPGIIDQDRTIADALDDALARAPRLWHRRQATGPLLTDIGVVATKVGAYDPDQSGLEAISLDLTIDRVVGLTGSPDDRDGLARAVIVDLTTRYGPADVDLAVATTPDELQNWDWAKWLPHARNGSSVSLLTNELEMGALIDRTLERPTVLVVTDDELWNSANTPLRSYVMEPPKNLAVIVLTANRSAAPASATAIVEIDDARPGHATLVRVTNNAVALDLYVPLVDIETAASASRRLAPLIDPDRAGPNVESVPLLDLDDVIRLGEAPRRWGTMLGSPDRPVEMGIGIRSTPPTPVGVDLGVDRGAVVSGSSINEAIDIANVLVLSAAAAWSPAEASLLIVDHRSTPGNEPLHQLPHHVGTFARRDRSSVNMLLERLRSDFSERQPGAERLVIVVVGLEETELAAPALIDGLVDLAAETSGVHLVVATARPLATLSPEMRLACSIEIAIDRYGGVRRATLSDQHRRRPAGFIPFDDTASSAAPVAVRPFVFGRQPSALERLLERGTQERQRAQDHPASRAARELARLAADQGIGASALLPTPLPTQVFASRLWSAHHGDGVPLGVLDSAADGEEPYWWQPGPDGSVVLVGTPRSGVRSAFDVLLVGIDRFSTDDIEVYAIDPNVRRRNLIARLPHVRRVESPEHHAAIDAMLTDIEATLHDRLQGGVFRLRDHRSVLLMLRDLDRLSDLAIDRLARIVDDGPDVGVNVLAIATRPGRADPLVRASKHLIVGALSDPEHYEQLGVQRSSNIEDHVGRAQIVGKSFVQLAELDAPLDQVVDALLSLIDSENLASTTRTPSASNGGRER